jgi:hypothetical protein
MEVHLNNGGEPVSQSVSPSRAAYGSYKAPIEARAAVAVDLIELVGCSVQEVAAALCVNPTYVRPACNLSVGDLSQLANGELTLAQVARDYRQRLAERRAQREQAASASSPTGTPLRRSPTMWSKISSPKSAWVVSGVWSRS